MHPQLIAVREEFGTAGERLRRLAAAVPEELWVRRAASERWSVGECVAHLNLTSYAYLPLLRQALERARSLGEPPPRRYHRDPTGWLLWRSAGPPVRRRVRTTPPFVPTALVPKDEMLAEFQRLQQEQLRCVDQADGLPLGRIWIISPFDARLRYNTYACLTILPRHQHRHLWQGEQVWAQLAVPTAAAT